MYIYIYIYIIYIYIMIVYGTMYRYVMICPTCTIFQDIISQFLNLPMQNCILPWLVVTFSQFMCTLQVKASFSLCMCIWNRDDPLLVLTHFSNSLWGWSDVWNDHSSIYVKVAQPTPSNDHLQESGGKLGLPHDQVSFWLPD